MVQQSILCHTWSKVYYWHYWINYNILTFLNYAIKKQQFTFTASEITSKLNLPITPSAFGKLLNNNIANLEKEGLYIEQKRTANERTYIATYKEPNFEND